MMQFNQSYLNLILINFTFIFYFLFFFQNVSFTASPGEVVALVGHSGGGKSTCVNLLQHFYEPEKGSVMLDGIPVSQLQHKYLHSQVGYRLTWNLYVKTCHFDQWVL